MLLGVAKINISVLMNYLKGFLHGRCQEPRYVPDDYIDSLVPRVLKVKQGEI